MKAAFLCDSDLINSVYGEKNVSQLKQMFDFYDGIFRKEDAGELMDVECIFSTWGIPSFTEEEIREYFPKLKIVFYSAGSVQHFAKPFLNLGIKVISGWRANAIPVIEYSVAQIILANKGFFSSMRMYKNSECYQDGFDYARTYPGNYDVNVGIIGLGAIGSGVAQSLKNYQLNVYAYDPYATEERASVLGVTLLSLPEIFEKCQVISNHAPNLPNNQKMIDKRHFGKMQKMATFINTGRGSQIVEEDLIEALKKNPLATAVLDVTCPEPPVDGSELFTLPNVFLTPHIAGSLGNEVMRMSEYITEDASAFASGKALKYEVSLEMLETMA